MQEQFGARVLLVVSEPATRRLLRVGLETDGFVVMEAGTASLATRLLRLEPGAVVVDHHLADAEGTEVIEAVAAACPDALSILHAAPGELVVGPPGLHVVDEGDIPAVLDLLAPLRQSQLHRTLAVSDMLAHGREELLRHWAELCRWDPMLPPESEPLVPEELLDTLAEAVQRPQPLGWGADPGLERTVAQFTAAAGSVEVAVEQLVCLRQAAVATLMPRVPAGEVAETQSRIHMLIDRAIGLVVRQSASKLETEAYTDPLTGLRNRRALERDLRRELRRADRYRRPVTVVVLDVDGLKVVNDRDGHLAGDLLLKGLTACFLEGLRQTDIAYRMGGDEFAMILPETDAPDAHMLLQRIAERAPSFSWGTASVPIDGDDPVGLLDLADQRLYARRAEVRTANAGP